MAGTVGILNIQDSDRVYISTEGQAVIYDAVTEYLNRYNADMARALSALVVQTTENHKERFRLPGGGRMQRRGEYGSPAAVKATGYWDVAYPLEDFAVQVANTKTALAYMTVAEYEMHIQTVTNQYRETLRFEMLKSLFYNTSRTFSDERWGDLTLQPLANGDSVVYPPVLGSESEATEDHYLESGYAAASISDTNDPFATIREDLEQHFGVTTGGDNICAFINQAQTAKVKAMTGFTEIPDRFIRMGDNADIPVQLPNVPGVVIGRVSGCWVSEWRWVPDGYILGVHLEAPAPLKKRVDPAYTNLPSELTLVATNDEFPLEGAIYQARYGLAVANRLNGVVMELGTGGTYTIPTAFQ